MCPPPAAAPPSKPLPALHDLSVAEVAAFVASLGPSGSRQTCLPGCPLVNYFNASQFIERGMHGAALARLVHAHDARAWVHNISLRAAHAAWLTSHGVLGADDLKSEQRIALMTRLRDALRHAGFAAPEPRRRSLQVQQRTRRAQLRRHREK